MQIGGSPRSLPRMCALCIHCTPAWPVGPFGFRMLAQGSYYCMGAYGLWTVHPALIGERPGCHCY
eukprot:1197154-Alexandrium_andersonii.AAC.1